MLWRMSPRNWAPPTPSTWNSQVPNQVMVKKEPGQLPMFQRRLHSSIQRLVSCAGLWSTAKCTILFPCSNLTWYNYGSKPRGESSQVYESHNVTSNVQEEGQAGIYQNFMFMWRHRNGPFWTEMQAGIPFILWHPTRSSFAMRFFFFLIRCAFGETAFEISCIGKLQASCIRG